MLQFNLYLKKKIKNYSREFKLNVILSDNNLLVEMKNLDRVGAFLERGRTLFFYWVDRFNF